jgi:hypothetical protein
MRTKVLQAVCHNYEVVSTLLECTCWSGGLEPLIINLDIRWRWVIIFTSWPLYSGEISSGFHWTEIWTFSRAGCIPSTENQQNLNSCNGARSVHRVTGKESFCMAYFRLDDEEALSDNRGFYDHDDRGSFWKFGNPFRLDTVSIRWTFSYTLDECVFVEVLGCRRDWIWHIERS